MDNTIYHYHCPCAANNPWCCWCGEGLTPAEARWQDEWAPRDISMLTQLPAMPALVNDDGEEEQIP